MFEVTGKTPQPADLRALNPPQPAPVRADHRGVPLRVRRRSGEWVAVAQVCDRWRVDTNWWTEREVSRMYWELELANGERLTLYRDLLTLHWYRHSYGPRG